ncbi:uncharacterized protein TRIVIDRAFT_54691 [Trichoderma virens Gv29-8]|uniref:Succinate dehydrogenase [ubiquinone] cytochrome b small subunit n=1 Tax=Hypocrea virens (strain Gv29-8 / FGSC 10586) TaxID=413071 RepID=G9MKG0_HYPVG|nr:uncharacterized protein TRIVIDRAFT_54691 [Trichoderma virens Gv29-8]EHK25134.1 hypothetical protein TRIVIDRAFT_54691 [Trichoderma virens Gv29-8]UKZ49042.1 hypothetical protein TrVGV298_003281 [Trichoderma virens]
MASIVRPSLLRQTALAARCAKPAFRSNAIKASAFHTSTQRSAILPPGPLNDPVPIPNPSAAHGSYHWTFERLLAAGLVPLSIAPFAAGSLNPTTDAILCSAILLHSHIGFQSVIIDYIPKTRYSGLRKIFWWGLNVATVTVGVGLYEFETNDIGVTEAIKKIWKA